MRSTKTEFLSAHKLEMDKSSVGAQNAMMDKENGPLHTTLVITKTTIIFNVNTRQSNRLAHPMDRPMWERDLLQR